MAVVSSIAARIRQWLPGGAPTIESSLWFTTGDGLCGDSVIDTHAVLGADTADSAPGALPASPPLQGQMFQGGPNGARTTLPRLRYETASLLLDCDVAQRDSVIARIGRAPAAIDLWLLRIDVFQCVSRVHGQSEACRRINSLLPHFAGWLPVRNLHEIC